jgi:hypothetical protein
MLRTTSCVKIGEQESNFVGDIDPTKRGLEFQAVKRDESGLESHDVGGVQITMALAYAPVFATLEHPWRYRSQLPVQDRSQVLKGGSAVKGKTCLNAFLEIVCNDGMHHRGISPRCGRLSDR